MLLTELSTERIEEILLDPTLADRLDDPAIYLLRQILILRSLANPLLKSSALATKLLSPSQQFWKVELSENVAKKMRPQRDENPVNIRNG